MGSLFRDVRYAARILSKSPGFTLVAIGILALGIGANTAIFTVANALLVRPLPYADPDRLVLVSARQANDPADTGELSLPFFNVLNQRSRSFSGLAACIFETFSLTGHGDAEQVYAARTSWNFFDVLGVRPIAGRGFTRGEDQRGGAQVVLISYKLAMRLFGAERAAVGHTITLDSREYTIAGVLPAGFSFSLLGTDVDIWAPRVFEMSLITPARVAAGGRYFQAVGRLRPGVSREQARAEAQVLFRQYKHDNPGNFDATMDLEANAGDLQKQMVADVRPAVLILLGAVGLVLLIACANVASLLLSRALGRRKEFAVRTALGGSRGALIRQLLIESILIGLAGGVLGIFLGQAGTGMLSAFGQSTLPGTKDIGMDWRVLAFTLGISVLSGIIFGLAPSMQLSNPDINSILRDEGRGTAGNRRRHRVRSVLVIAQVALSMVLLIGAGLLIRSFTRLRGVSPGFNPRNLLTMQISLRKYARPQEGIAFYKNVIERVSMLPGVEAAGISTALPPTATHQTPAVFEGQPALALGKRPIINIQQISPGYAKALGVPLVRGRTFTDHDDAGAPKVAIINERAARRFFPGENAIGKKIWIGRTPDAAEIVGIFGDVRNLSLAAPTEPEVFLPFPQLPWSFLCLSIRTKIDPHSLITAVRREIAAVDRDQPVIEVHTGEELLEASEGQTRFMMFLVGVFSATAFILAIVGIYGVIAYSVSQRTPEIGVRIALGAARGDVLRLVLIDGLILCLSGIAIGCTASLALTRMISSLLYQTSTTDPATFLTSAVLFTAVAVAASLIPARRAMRIDPTDALRSE
ncbi:MAG TPA: ABC transporter permease [Bryobacteraceae bacterium]|nr:ABC transporter permease [Bryobacteraceae bacterium]